jgi:hypothetical protein
MTEIKGEPSDRELSDVDDKLMSPGWIVRGEAHINTAESYFAVFKRGIYGTYHHVSQKHLKRYLCEFDFRYNERSALGVEDSERTTKALSGIVGKRLMYRDSSAARP